MIDKSGKSMQMEATNDYIPKIQETEYQALRYWS